MFSKQVIDSDAFSDMPLTAQALYFHLANSWLSREQDSGGSKQAELNQNSAFKLSGDYESL